MDIVKAIRSGMSIILYGTGKKSAQLSQLAEDLAGQAQKEYHDQCRLFEWLASEGATYSGGIQDEDEDELDPNDVIDQYKLRVRYARRHITKRIRKGQISKKEGELQLQIAINHIQTTNSNIFNGPASVVRLFPRSDGFMFKSAILNILITIQAQKEFEDEKKVEDYSYLYRNDSGSSPDHSSEFSDSSSSKDEEKPESKESNPFPSKKSTFFPKTPQRVSTSVSSPSSSSSSFSSSSPSSSSSSLSSSSPSNFSCDSSPSDRGERLARRRSRTLAQRKKRSSHTPLKRSKYSLRSPLPELTNGLVSLLRPSHVSSPHAVPSKGWDDVLQELYGHETPSSKLDSHIITSMGTDQSVFDHQGLTQSVMTVDSLTEHVFLLIDGLDAISNQEELESIVELVKLPNVHCLASIDTMPSIPFMEKSLLFGLSPFFVHMPTFMPHKRSKSRLSAQVCRKKGKLQEKQEMEAEKLENRKSTLKNILRICESIPKQSVEIFSILLKLTRGEGDADPQPVSLELLLLAVQQQIVIKSMDYVANQLSEFIDHGFIKNNGSLRNKNCLLSIELDNEGLDALLEELK
ncbi:Origin recognition complex, subunit 2 like protein [Aduncisulcus paluster]|uniref:Origin recognition complex, subunit 2 like protein n=1 Tax=Aduncisulcus paluster TaxID=2918883 RepID=A0ABQ5K1X1_9EUKA|nr:Origin recognition complex, subunit 2 like protein [Aduncisulcus paluster]